MPTRDERMLLADARRGDHDAFRLIVETHQARVFSLAAFQLRDRPAASEVAHEAFVRLFQNLDRFRGDASIATWLHRVTINLCHDLHRDQRRRRIFVPIDEARAVAAPQGDHPDAAALSRASDPAVRHAISQLPKELRDVLSLRYGADLSYGEIAAALGWPLGTVCTRLHRAIAALGASLADRSESGASS